MSLSTHDPGLRRRIGGSVRVRVRRAGGLLHDRLVRGARLPLVAVIAATAAVSAGLLAADGDAAAEPYRPGGTPSALGRPAVDSPEPGVAASGPGPVPLAPTIAPPGGVSGLTGSGGDRTARLCWKSADGADTYLLEYRDATLGEAWTAMPYPIDDVCYTARQLSNAHTFEFRISATNLAGTGTPSKVVRVTAGLPIPAAVTGLTGAPGPASAELCWRSATGADAYRLDYRDTTTGQDWTPMPYAIDGLCYTARQLVNGHTYEFRITAANSAGTGTPSNTVAVTPAA